MKRSDFYPASLPEEFSPPDVAAARIAALDTRAAREALWLRIPEAWRKEIGHLASLFIGGRIAEMKSVDERRAALAEVPGIWLEDVQWHVRRLYATREVRAEWRAEQEHERRKAVAGGKW